MQPVPIPGNDALLQRCLSQPAHSDLMRITRLGRCVTIGFNSGEIGDDATCWADNLNEFFDLIESGECDRVIFDLTGVRAVLGGLLELLFSVHEQNCDVEILNPPQQLQEILRAAKLDTWPLIRGTTM